MASDTKATSKLEEKTGFTFSVYQAAVKLPTKEFSVSWLEWWTNCKIWTKHMEIVNIYSYYTMKE